MPHVEIDHDSVHTARLSGPAEAGDLPSSDLRCSRQQTRLLLLVQAGRPHPSPAGLFSESQGLKDGSSSTRQRRLRAGADWHRTPDAGNGDGRQHPPHPSDQTQFRGPNNGNAGEEMWTNVWRFVRSRKR